MPNELNMAIFSKRLKEARTDKNMTQKELSEKSGVSTVMISAYERNNTSSGKNPALNNIYAIATALGVSIDWLCGLTEKNELNKNQEKIDTETLLKSFINIIDHIKYRKSVGYDDFLNGYNESILTISFDLRDSVSSLGRFINEYCEVKSLVDKKLLPKGVDNTVIQALIDKYKNSCIRDLINGTITDDDLPF